MTRIRLKYPAAPAKRPHVVRKTAQGALDEDVSGRHIQVQLPAPEGPTQVRQPAAGQTLDGREHGAAVSDHEPSIRGRGQELRPWCYWNDVRRMFS